MIELQTLGAMGTCKEQALLLAPYFPAPLAEPVPHVSDRQHRRIVFLEQQLFESLREKSRPRVSGQALAIAPDVQGLDGR